MANLSQFSQQDIYKLLNHEKIDVSNGVLLGGGTLLQPESSNRMILIGIGGTGVSTINRIKGVISKRLAPTWTNYVAFLALDTDWDELKKAKNLEPREKLMYTQPGVTQRYKSRGTYPDAAHRFMPDGYPIITNAMDMGDMSLPGANQERLVGMAKIHDKQAGAAMGVDEEIVKKLQQIQAAMTLNVGHGHYEVYVIGSGSGGTGSGAFVDMPALIREAIPDAHIYSMLFLPDTLSGSIPSQIHARLKANGYATLKEMNYYQGVEMRGEGYPAVWGYNGTAKKVDIDHNRKYFDIPYLVGSPAGGASASAGQGARKAIAEFLISLMTKLETKNNQAFMTDSFLANAETRDKWDNRPADYGDPTKEAANTYHNFPKAFAAMGFAKATAPEELVRAYQASLICKEAGIKPVNEEERRQQPEGMRSFRKEDDVMSYSAAEAAIDKILKPLEDFLDKVIHNVTYDCERGIGGAMTFEAAKADTSDAAQDAEVRNQTNEEKLHELEQKIDDKYAEYEENVKAFVKAEGPFAFVNLYNGFYHPDGNKTALGIGDRLNNLVNGKNMDGSVYAWIDEAQANERINAARTLLNECPDSAVGKFFDKMFAGKRAEATAAWVSARNSQGNAKIFAKRRSHCLKNEGYFNKSFVHRAAELAEDLKSFGNLLTALSDTYSGHGVKMENYTDFRNANEDETHVNAAAVSATSYAWLKQKAEDALALVQARTFRDKVVDDFFGKDQKSGKLNRKKWLEVPDELYTRENNQVKLLTEDGAIPARERFDRLVVDAVPNPISVSIQDLFTTLQQKGVNYATAAAQYVDELYAASKPRFNADAQRQTGVKVQNYIVYPANMTGAEGTAIEKALCEAAQKKDSQIQCYASYDADGIMFYQMVTGLEAHMLADIGKWELEYEAELSKQNNKLHGKSPDTQLVDREGKQYFQQTIPWAEYPALTAKRDVESPDPITHRISREGQRRIAIRKKVEKAKKLGVLYSEKDAFGNWSVYRVWCDYLTPEWNFNMTRLPQDDQGLFLMGKDMAQSVAVQNGRNLRLGDPDSMIRVVRLNHAGLLSMAHADENVAWEYAIRTLFENTQMYAEVLNTLTIFAKWGDQVDKINEAIKQRLRPAKMAYLIKSRILYRRDNDQWMLKHPDGFETLVANLSPDMLIFSPDGAKQMIDNKLLGYYLFRVVDSMLPGNDLNRACKMGVENLRDLAAAQNMDDLKEGKKWVDTLLEERVHQISMGAREAITPMDEDKPPVQRYLSFLAQIGLDNEAKKIEQFYSRMGTVNNLLPQHFN